MSASDLVQETFLDAHRQFADFEGLAEPQFVAWLKTILAGRLANAIRRYLGTQRRDVRLERSIEQEFDRSSCALSHLLIADDASPSRNLMREEQSVAVARALSSIAADYRSVLTMRHIEGLSFPEIAARMKRSVDSVEKLWMRGLAKLKQACRDLSDGS